MCPGTESNRRHEDFQSSALPTELPGQNKEKQKVPATNEAVNQAGAHFFKKMKVHVPVAAIKRATALPRWLTAAFSEGMASANVLPNSGEKKIGS
jgi:hypothetical protein